MSIRTSRVSALIKQEISVMLTREIDTSGFGLMTVTDVIMTPDLRLAKVYISHYHSGKRNEEILAFLETQNKAIRMWIGKTVRLKFTPEIRFFIDETMERMERMEKLFAQIHKEEENR